MYLLKDVNAPSRTAKWSKTRNICKMSQEKQQEQEQEQEQQLTIS